MYTKILSNFRNTVLPSQLNILLQSDSIDRSLYSRATEQGQAEQGGTGGEKKEKGFCR